MNVIVLMLHFCSQLANSASCQNVLGTELSRLHKYHVLQNDYIPDDNCIRIGIVLSELHLVFGSDWVSITTGKKYRICFQCR